MSGKPCLYSELENERITFIESVADTGEEPLIKLLVEHIAIERSAFVRRRLISVLGNMASDYVIHQAADQLLSEEAAVRNAALEVLVIQRERSITALLKLLKHPSRDIRKMAADALGRIGLSSTTDGLVSGLKDDDANVVIACAEALGTIGASAAIPALEKALYQENNFWTAFALLGALVKIQDSAVMSIADHYLDLRRWELPEGGAMLKQWCTAAARFGDSAIFAKALGMYAAHGLSSEDLLELTYGYSKRGLNLEHGKSILVSLLPGEIERDASLKSADLASRYCPEVVWNCASTLAERFGADAETREELAHIFRTAGPAEERVCEMLKNDSENTIKTMLLVAEWEKFVVPVDLLERLAAIRDSLVHQKLVVLAERNGKDARHFLEMMCEHADDEVKRLAADTLRVLEATEPTESLIRSLLHVSQAVRSQAVKSLLPLPSSLFEENLRDVYSKASVSARPDILTVALGWKHPSTQYFIEDLLACEDTAVRLRTARTCRKIDDEGLFLYVMRLLANDADEEVRRAAIINLAQRRGEAIYEYLSYLYKHDSCQENRYFILNCEELFEPKHRGLTWRWLEENFGSGDRLLQLAAVKGFVRMGLDGSEYLLKIVEDKQCDEVAMEIIRQQLKRDGGSDRCN